MEYQLNKLISNRSQSNLDLNLNLKRTKKGIFFVEIVFIVLVLVTTYTIISQSLENKREELSKLEIIELNNIKITELCSQLISSTGVPKSWQEVDQVNILGLREENTTVLSSQKINELTNFTTTYMVNLNLDEFQIVIKELNTNSIISQTNNSFFSSTNSNHQLARCYGINELGEDLIVEVNVK